MTAHLIPILFALFLWWFSTGAVIYLDGLPRRTYRWSFLAMSALAVVAIVGIAETRNDTSVTAAYLAFTYGLILWAWIELAFYAGIITGPRTTPCACPRGTVSLRHAWHATETLLYNQLLCLVAALGLAIATWESANPLALWTFVLLWVLQCSAKLNVFLGVRNLNEAFLPQHMAHLRHFMRKSEINPFLPVSITVGTIACVMLVVAAHNADAAAGPSVGYALLATLLALGILEHWLLVLPIPAERLWSWSLTDGHVRGDDATDDNWRFDLAPTCDETALSQLLEGIAGGDYGAVQRLEGVARDRSGLVTFAAAPGRKHISRLEDCDHQQIGCAHAIGQRIDKARLQAAFLACRDRRFAT
ncbi:MAG: putative photosynthetic complex assembly protein PuhE [Pseudomonadota bacterium]